jgi:uncharacterized membrane protein
MQMILDSILTLTKAEAAWLFFFLLVCVGIDRGVAAIGGPPLTFFALLAVMLVAFFVVGLHRWQVGAPADSQTSELAEHDQPPARFHQTTQRAAP